MVETIAPGVHGGRGRRYWSMLALHTAAAGLAGAASGALLGALGGVAGAPWGVVGPLILTAIAISYALREIGGVPLPLPGRRAQVPDWWRTFFSPGVAATLYGVGLGVGFLTFVTFGTLVAVAAAALVYGDPWVGATILGAFGASRALAVGVSATSATNEATARLVDRLEDAAGARLPRLVNGVTLAAVAAGVAASLA